MRNSEENQTTVSCKLNAKLYKEKLMMSKLAHVVIGGGVIGCSIAYYLAKRGVKVILIEKRPGLCLGASGSNQGGCSFYYDNPDVDRIAVESAKLFDSLSQELGYDVEYRPERRLTCSINEEQSPYMKKRLQNLLSSGREARLLEGDEIRKLEPAMGKDIVLGIEQETGVVNPFKLNYGFGYAAGKLGAEFLFATEIRSIEAEKGSIVSVVTDKGKIETNCVINAAGAWSAEIGEMVGLTIPIKPRRGQIIVTEPVPFNKRWRRIADIDFSLIVFGGKDIEESKDLRLRLGVAGAYYQDETGNWTIGSSQEFAGYDEKVTIQTLKQVAKRAVKFIPGLRDVNCIRMFAGLRPFCYVDGHPIISKVDNPAGFFIAGGHSGHGIGLAPITGKLIAELVTENRTSTSIDAFSFSRFKKQELKQTAV
ncbi:NAD(P)/FAD-dependent oxidoreductase [Chloroflexota bacterium]